MTHLLAVSASDPSLTAWALVGIVAWLVFYTVECVVFPWRSCPRCAGKGKLHSPVSRGFRPCRRCGGRARQLRWGRRLWSGAADLADAVKSRR